MNLVGLFFIFFYFMYMDILIYGWNNNNLIVFLDLTIWYFKLFINYYVYLKNIELNQ